MAAGSMYYVMRKLIVHSSCQVLMVSSLDKLVSILSMTPLLVSKSTDLLHVGCRTHLHTSWITMALCEKKQHDRANRTVSISPSQVLLKYAISQECLVWSDSVMFSGHICVLRYPLANMIIEIKTIWRHPGCWFHWWFAMVESLFTLTMWRTGAHTWPNEFKAR